MRRRLLAVLIGGLLPALALPALAAAAPVTVNLRIEGKSRTLYEAPVTTDVGPIDVGDGTGAHACDGTATPAVTTPAPTRGNAIMSAARGPGGFGFTATYSFDLQFSEIAGDNVAFDPGTFEFLAEYKNGRFADFGSCGDQIANGDDVLYAYATGAEQLLKLSGPATAAPGAAATLTVTDAATGTPVAGADVGGLTTGTDGTVQPTLGDRGPHAFKATKAGAIRSNRIDVCATDGGDGACGSPSPPPPESACPTSGSGGLCGSSSDRAPRATLTGIKDHQRFARGKGPRRLRATIAFGASGIRAVKLRLTRNDRGRCTYFSGTSERFRTNRRAKCGAENGFWFDVGTDPTVDYLLPRALPRGHYVLDVNVIDKALHRDDARRRGANRIVFDVA
jgi:hypothetical protein